MTKDELEHEFMHYKTNVELQQKRKESYRNLRLLNIFFTDIYDHEEDVRVQNKCSLAMNMLNEIQTYINMLEKRADI